MRKEHIVSVFVKPKETNSHARPKDSIPVPERRDKQVCAIPALVVFVTLRAFKDVVKSWQERCLVPAKSDKRQSRVETEGTHVYMLSSLSALSSAGKLSQCSRSESSSDCHMSPILF